MQFVFSPDDLKPVIAEVVAELLERFGNDDRIGFTETEAAQLLGVARHVLRDERLKGRVRHGKVGRRVIYSRRQLLEFVEAWGE